MRNPNSVYERLFAHDRFNGQNLFMSNPDAELPDYVDVKVVLPEEVENTSKADILDFTNPTKEMILDLFA